MEAAGMRLALGPEERAVAYLVRERSPASSPARRCAWQVRGGGRGDHVADERRRLIVADRMEQDRITFDWAPASP
jgi:hypothetical protein